MGIKVTNAELKSIIAEVEAGLGELLKSETEKLQKASEEAPPEKSEESSPAESAPAESAPAEAPAESAPAESAPAESAPAASAPAEGAPPVGEVPQDEAAVLAEPDHDALCQELGAMPPEHVKAVYLAAKAVLLQGAQQPAPAASPAPEAASAAAPAASAPAGSPPPGLGKDEMDMSEAKKAEVGATKWEKKEVGATKWEKGEVPSVPANGGEMKKSEVEVALEKAQEHITNLQSQVQGLARVAELTVGLPRQKAITGLSFVPKGEDLTKSELPALSRTDALKKLAEKAGTSLSKSDREAINTFTLNPKADLSAVAHLLK